MNRTEYEALVEAIDEHDKHVELNLDHLRLVVDKAVNDFLGENRTAQFALIEYKNAYGQIVEVAVEIVYARALDLRDLELINQLQTVDVDSTEVVHVVAHNHIVLNKIPLVDELFTTTLLNRVRSVIKVSQAKAKQ